MPPDEVQGWKLGTCGQPSVKAGLCSAASRDKNTDGVTHDRDIQRSFARVVDVLIRSVGCIAEECLIYLVGVLDIFSWSA